MTPFRLRKRLPRRTFLRAPRLASALALAGCDNLSRTEWFPKVLDSVEPLNDALAKLVGRKAHGAGVRGVRPLARRSAATAPTIPDTRPVQRVGAEPASPTTRSTSAGCARRRASSRWPSCARCRRARRSRATTASKAGARSPSGRARGSSALLDVVKPKPEARYVMFYCADPMAAGRHRPVLREHRLRRRAPRADDPRLRPERRAAAGAQRRAAAAARRAPAGLQARQVHHRASSS